MLLFVAALAVTVLVLTRDRGPSRRGLSRPELTWVHRYGGWWAGTYDRQNGLYEEATLASSREALIAPFASLRGCRSSYRHVAEPTPKSFADVRALSLSACRWASRAADDYARMRRVPSAKAKLLGGVLDLISADRGLMQHLVLESHLPLRDGPAKGSRVDARYSHATTNAVFTGTQVRCWSAKDWAAIQRETSALGAETSRKFYGAADAFQGVVNLSPKTCTTLDRLAYGGNTGVGDKLVRALVELGSQAERGGGVGSSVAAECDAVQDVDSIAAGIGAPRAEAEKLAQRAWQLYRSRRLHVSLWTADCRNGGPLDKDATARWP
jgi:hypothetical protein